MKKIIAMLLACMMVIGLAACGGNADTTTAAPAGPEAVTLKVWAPQEDQVDANCWLPLMEAAFAAAHPEYVITWDNGVCGEGDAGNTMSPNDIFIDRTTT